MYKFLAPIALAAAVAVAGTAVAQTGAVVAGTAPGKGGVAEVVKLTATITAIDKASRDVTLKGPQGNEVTLTAGPEVKNFDQMKVGDQVNVEYVQALTLELKKGGGLVVARTEQKGAVAAKPGETPAGAKGARSRSWPTSSPSTRPSSRSRSRGRSRPSKCGSGPRAVQAHREGRPGRGDVHAGGRDGPRAGREEVAHRAVDRKRAAA